MDHLPLPKQKYSWILSNAIPSLGGLVYVAIPQSHWLMLMLMGINRMTAQWNQVPFHRDYITTLQESHSYGLNIWERAQCLPIQSKILCNIKELALTHFPKMKSVFIAPIMQLETLKIMNCDELKYIIIDIGDHNTDGKNLVNVFPKLKELYVEGCAQLEYIVGHATNDHQNHMEIQLHLPELRHLDLCNLPCL
ncbi:NB-ARC domain disease resistance protein, partial [Trifolium medium]|nr:NB-ARC domain disease resistance protein [Trifolium medium]